jgi:hypothetical protein
VTDGTTPQQPRARAAPDDLPIDADVGRWLYRHPFLAAAAVYAVTLGACSTVALVSDQPEMWLSTGFALGVGIAFVVFVTYRRRDLGRVAVEVAGVVYLPAVVVGAMRTWPEVGSTVASTVGASIALAALFPVVWSLRGRTQQRWEERYGPHDAAASIKR